MCVWVCASVPGLLFTSLTQLQYIRSHWLVRTHLDREPSFTYSCQKGATAGFGCTSPMLLWNDVKPILLGQLDNFDYGLDIAYEWKATKDWSDMFIKQMEILLCCRQSSIEGRVECSSKRWSLIKRDKHALSTWIHGIIWYLKNVKITKKPSKFLRIRLVGPHFNTIDSLIFCYQYHTNTGIVLPYVKYHPKRCSTVTNTRLSYSIVT